MATGRNYGLHLCLVFMFFVYSSQLSLSKCPILVQNQLTEMNLCNTSAHFPLECLPEIVDLGFPLKLFKANNGKRVIMIKKMLQLLFHFFMNNKPYNAWDSTCIRNVLISLHQQINQLEKCLDSKEAQKELTDSEHKVYAPILQIQSYFQRINDFLQVKQYSTCAWKVIHIEISNHFLLMTQLLQMLIK